MSDNVKYTINFPPIEIEAIHAKAAIEEAAQWYKDHPLEVQWSEVEEDQS